MNLIWSEAIDWSITFYMIPSSWFPPLTAVVIDSTLGQILSSFWNLSRNIQIVRPKELIWWLKMQCNSMSNGVARWMGPLNFNVRSTKYLNSQSFSWRSNWSSNKLNQWKLKLVTGMVSSHTILCRCWKHLRHSWKLVMLSWHYTQQCTPFSIISCNVIGWM